MIFKILKLQLFFVFFYGRAYEQFAHAFTTIQIICLHFFPVMFKKLMKDRKCQDHRVQFMKIYMYMKFITCVFVPFITLK